MISFVTESAKRLERNNGLEELAPWLWSGTVPNHSHGASSSNPLFRSKRQTTITPAHFVLLRIAGPEEGNRLLGILSDLIPVCNC